MGITPATWNVARSVARRPSSAQRKYSSSSVVPGAALELARRPFVEDDRRRSRPPCRQGAPRDASSPAASLPIAVTSEYGTVRAPTVSRFASHVRTGVALRPASAAAREISAARSSGTSPLDGFDHDAPRIDEHV